MKAYTVALLFCAIFDFGVAQTPVASFMYDVSITWCNDNVAPDACTDAEQDFLSRKMLPKINMILNKDGFDAVDRMSNYSRRPSVRALLRGQDNEHALPISNPCATCNLGPTYCNAMYNCGFRRKVTVVQREGMDSTAATSELQVQFNSACVEQITQLSTHRMLSAICRAALAGSTCETVFW